MRQNNRNTRIGAWALLALGVVALPTQASTVTSLFQTGLNTVHDVNLEYLSHDANGDGHLDMGDVISGYISFSQVLNSNGAALGLNSGNDQLTAFIDVQVTGKTSIGGGQFAFTFGPDTSGQKFLNGQPNAGGSTFTSLYGPGAMVAVYTASSGQPNFLNNTLSAGTSLSTAASGVTAGSLFWVLGFKNPAQAATISGSTIIPSTDGEGWAATGSDDLTLNGINTGSILGHVNFTVNLLPSAGIGNSVNPLLQTIDPGTAASTHTIAGQTVQFIGSSTIRGAGSSSAFSATSDSDVTFLIAPVPLPTAAKMSTPLLIGMVGVAALRYRARSKAL